MATEELAVKLLRRTQLIESAEAEAAAAAAVEVKTDTKSSTNAHNDVRMQYPHQSVHVINNDEQRKPIPDQVSQRRQQSTDPEPIEQLDHKPQQAPRPLQKPPPPPRPHSLDVHGDAASTGINNDNQSKRDIHKNLDNLKNKENVILSNHPKQTDSQHPAEPKPAIVSYVIQEKQGVNKDKSIAQNKDNPQQTSSFGNQQLKSPDKQRQHHHQHEKLNQQHQKPQQQLEQHQPQKPNREIVGIHQNSQQTQESELSHSKLFNQQKSNCEAHESSENETLIKQVSRDTKGIEAASEQSKSNSAKQHSLAENERLINTQLPSPNRQQASYSKESGSHNKLQGSTNKPLSNQHDSQENQKKQQMNQDKKQPSPNIKQTRPVLHEGPDKQLEQLLNRQQQRHQILEEQLARQLSIDGENAIVGESQQMESFMPSMLIFNPYTEFKEMSRKEIQHYQKFFKQFDVNNDKFIDFEELKRMMEKLGSPQTHLALKAMIREVDEDQDNMISFREFLLIFRKAKANELGEDSGLLELYRYVNVIDVTKEGIKGAANFFEAKVAELTESSRFEQEIREEQQERARVMEEKKQRRAAFKATSNIFQQLQ